MPDAHAQLPDPADELAARVVAAVRVVTGVELELAEALIRGAAPEHGADYQSNVAMALGKRVGRPARELAAELARALDVAGVCEAPTVAGPGFINLRLLPAWIGARLAAIAGDERLGVARVDDARRVVVDYSSPNVAKEMHVGHLRSTIIGDALARLLGFAGYEVLRQNHIGDWGTPFGMLIEHMLDTGGMAGDEDGHGERSIADLGAFYQAAHAKFAADAGFAARARERVVALQAREPETIALWEELVRESGRHFAGVYRRLGVLLEESDVAGESAYEHELADVAAELERRGLARMSDGALCAFPQGFLGREGEPLPLIVRKRDGAYSYDTTDLAAVRHRARDLRAQELLYVVGAPQRLHFEMVFQVAREAGWLDGVAARHVAFGSVLGPDRKMLRTRAGAPVRLAELLEEAVQRAAAALAERGIESDVGLARTIGIGAVKYADLASDRERDYVFSFDRMLSFDGDTSVYLQYAHARACSVLRRAREHAGPGAGSEPGSGSPSGEGGGIGSGEGGGIGSGEGAVGDGAGFVLADPAERALALALLRLPGAVAATLADYRPHRLCGYLHELAVSFSTFYESCPVLSAEGRVRASRLGLCALVARTIALGLGLLGIEAPERLSPPPARAARATDARS